MLLDEELSVFGVDAHFAAAPGAVAGGGCAVSVHVFEDAQAAAQACASQVAEWLRVAVEERGSASLAVSGGSTPQRMFDALATLPVDWSRIHLFFVDERGVPPEDEASNYRMVREHLVGPCAVPEGNVHRMRGELDAATAARAYVHEIEAFWHVFDVKTRSFDVVLCGIGDDGHTASLFPGEPLVSDRARLCAGVWVEKKRQHRITLLPAPITGARHLLTLASGAGKAAAVALALEQGTDPLEVPAALLGEGHWFLDAAAASQV